MITYGYVAIKSGGASSNYFFSTIEWGYNTEKSTLALDSTDKIYLGCNAFDSESGLDSAFVVKLSSSGTFLSGQYSAGLASVGNYSVTPSGNLAGSSNSGTFQLSASNVLSNQYLDNTSTPQIYNGYFVDSSSNQYFVFFGTGNGPAIIKTDSSGNAIWKKNYTAVAFDGFTGPIKLSSSGKIYLFSTLYTATNRYATCLANDGSVLWSKSFAGNGAYEIMAVDSSDNSYYAFFTGTASSLMKLDSSGNKVWEKVFTSLYPSVLEVDSSGNVYVSMTGGRFIKLNSSGNIVWDRSFSCTGEITLNAVKINSIGDLVISASSASGLGTFFCLRLPADGSKTGSYTAGAFTLTYAVYAGATPSNGSTVLTSHTPTVVTSTKSIVATSFSSNSNTYPVAKKGI
jgi:hypothetical protein